MVACRAPGHCIPMHGILSRFPRIFNSVGNMASVSWDRVICSAEGVQGFKNGLGNEGKAKCS